MSPHRNTVNWIKELCVPHATTLSIMIRINLNISVIVGICMLSCFSCVQLFTTLWTVANQAPLPMGFSRQEHLRGCHALLQGIFLIQR